MIPRDIQKELLTCAAEYPTVTLTGPRQSGKTTLARLLTRLYDPQEGVVRLGGIAAREADVEDLRRALRATDREERGGRTAAQVRHVQDVVAEGHIGEVRDRRVPAAAGAADDVPAPLAALPEPPRPVPIGSPAKESLVA